MANEATILELSGLNPVNFTCYDSLNISKGALCKLSGDFTVTTSTAAACIFAGIAAADKVANDGSTKIALYVPGQNNIFDITNASTGTITLGGILALSGVNVVRQAIEAEMVTGAVVGKALEGASAGEVIRVIV